MEISQLRYFIRTAHELHFARAASKLGVAQPSLSRGIQSLEKELGTPLFFRANRWRISLTEAGKAFLPEAEKVLRQLQYATVRARAAGEGKYGHLTIGAISSTLGRSALIDTLADMQREYPEVAVEVIDSDSAGLTNHMRERTIDLALMRQSPEPDWDEELIHEKLYDDPLAVVLPRHHPLAAEPKLTVASLKNERFILVPGRTSPGFRDYICRFCETRGGFTPKVSEEISSSYTALRLTEAGLGITVVSSSYIGMFRERLCYRSFCDFRPMLPVFAVRVSGNDSPPLRNFLLLLKKRLHAETPCELS